MKTKRPNNNLAIENMKVPAGVEDLMKVYQRFQEAYTTTEQYLEIISPKTHQSNSNQSLVSEIR